MPIIIICLFDAILDMKQMELINLSEITQNHSIKQQVWT